MKIEKNEYKQNYSAYEFGYQIWAIPEKNDLIDSIYEKGFLPYSGLHYSTPRYYECRSARVRLDDFNLTSENRRILKKFDNTFSVQTFSGKEALQKNEFISCALSYFKQRHGDNIMTKERLHTICNYSKNVQIRVYSYQQKPVAYVVEQVGKKSAHYWFSFYDLSFAFQSFGMWLMTDYVQFLKNEGFTYAYLGTVYGARALYKTNFSSIEFWNGINWDQDIKKLKTLARHEIK